MNVFPIKQWSALIPMIMSIAALALVLGHVAIYGVVREADEGTPAHLFQILMAGQVPVIAFFAVKWLPREPKKAILVIVLQVAAAVPAFAAVYFLT